MLEVSFIKVRAAPCLRQAAWRVTLVALVAGLGGCQGGGAFGAGEDLFHGLEGGAIAQQRPPPPGVNDPFPKLGTIPKRPAAPDIVEEQHIADQLAVQRDQAEASAAANPLTPRPQPPALPKPTAPDPNANHVVVDAAATPPPPPAATARPAAPPNPSTAAAATPAAAAIPTLASVPAVPAAIASGPLPSLATAPPAGPVGLGILPETLVPTGSAPRSTSATSPATKPAATIPTAAATPAPVPPAAPATPQKSLLDRLLSPTVVPIPTGDTIYKPPVVPIAAAVQVDFTPGSAQLPPSATLNLRRFALAHKGVPITITGHGEATQPGVDSQSHGLDLALRRAQVIAASLGTDGIPATNLHLHAEAAGQGGSVGL